MSLLDRFASRLGYEKRPSQTAQTNTTEKNGSFEKKDEREGFANNPLAAAYQTLNTQYGLRTPSKVTTDTLRRMSRYNWVDRTCIFTLRDEVTAIPWSIAPIDPKRPYNADFQQFLIHLLSFPNQSGEVWRTLIDKVVEDILVIDAGCLWGKEPILLTDGSKMPIGQIVNQQLDVEVISFNEKTQQFEPKKVVGWHRNQLNGRKWVKVNYSHSRDMGRHGKMASWFTDDHQLLTENGWKEIKDITSNEKVVTYTFAPDRSHQELIDGTLLGDAGLEHRRGSSRSCLSLTHCTDQSEWLAIKTKALNCFEFSELHENNRGILRVRSNYVPYLQKEYSRWYKDGKKIVPRDLILSNRTLAAWYMDDGHLVNISNDLYKATSAAYLNTCGFTLEDQEYLASELSKVGIAAHVQKAGKYYRIYIGADGAKELFTRVAPFLPESMQYKIPPEFRKYYYDQTWDLGLPTVFMDTIEVVEGNPAGGKNPIPLTTYCIDVENNHNFIASGLVAHNCIEKVRNHRGMVVELWHVDGTTIKPMFDEHGVPGDPAYLQFLPGGKSDKPVAEFVKPDLMRILWNPQGAIDLFGWGMSPVEAGLAVGTAFLYAEAYNMGFFRTNAIPPVVVNMGKDVPPGEVDKFRTFLAAEMMGQEGWFKPIVGSFSEGFDIKEVLKSPTEMGFKEYVEWQMRWKVALYRMAPQDIGFGLDQYKVEGQVQQQLSKNKAINSLKDVIRGFITNEIINDTGYQGLGQNLAFQWIDTEAVDPLVQAQIDQIYLKNGKVSINELRKRDGEDPISGGIKPMISLSSALVPLDPTPIQENDETSKSTEQEEEVEKNFNPKEGTIVTLAQNSTAISWMDDRGVNQPLFVTDYGKSRGFTVKPNFLDEKKEQVPPEAKVSEILRAVQVNTPEVKIMSYDEVLKLLPESLYPDFTKWINLEPPYDSQEWRSRWGDTRKSAYYIVTGYLSGLDLGNADLQKQMASSPESYLGAVHDLARVWLAEGRFGLGDRKPGHYFITTEGNGFGVDYQFYEDPESWQRSKHWLPETLELINPKLKEAFDEYCQEEAKDFVLSKAFRGPTTPDDWDKMTELTEIEKDLAEKVQKKIYTWYVKAVNIKASKRLIVRKSSGFNPKESYITDGKYVYQNGVKYPMSVIGEMNAPQPSDLTLSTQDYRSAYDFGAFSAEASIRTQFPDLKLSTPKLLSDAFGKRVNLIASTVDDTLKQAIDATITRGISDGLTYGELADEIRNVLGVDANNPDMPGWRAERIARTESQWAINEGMRQAYSGAGIEKVNVEIASSACEICASIADGNPYTIGDAEGLIPSHPNCRCVLVGDYTNLLKALPNVVNQVDDKGFVDEDQMKHPVKGEAAFISFGELVSENVISLIKPLVDVLAEKVLNGAEVQEPFSEISNHRNLKTAISYATSLQQDHPGNAYAIVVRPDGFKKVTYVIYEYKYVE